MSNRRITKASKRRLSFFGTMCICIIIYFIFSLIYNIYTIYDLTKEKKKLENSYVELQKQAEELKIDIEKLNDPDYLANFARENYLYSKEGEYIIQLDKDINDGLNSVNDDLNNNYALIFLSIVMVFVFVYILTKERKKAK